MGFVFYDTETTGTETSFDQILQFAAIHTDPDLNELDRFEIRSRLLPGVVPSPGAMRVTGIKAAQLVDPTIPSHYEMIRLLQEKLLQWSPAVFLGYNSIAFDEHLLRHSLYKTLHLPYLTNTNGNARSDVMRMTQAAHLFYPGALKIPTGANGKLSFKLDLVAPANGFGHEKAHDALADVEATIFICRLLSERAPEVWSSFMRFSQKAAVIDYATSEPIFCFSDFYYGKPFSCLVTCLGQNPNMPSEAYLYDLVVDPESLMDLPEQQLIRRLNASPKPVRRLRCNASPILMPAEDAPAISTANALGMEELERRAGILEDNQELRDRLISAFESEKKDTIPTPYVEQQLYDNFFTEDDQQLLVEFHSVGWAERISVVNRLEDPRLKQLGFQLIYTECPEVLDKDHRRNIDAFHAQRLMSTKDDVPWLTLPKAQQELMRLIASSARGESEFYKEHLALVDEWTQRAKAFG